MNNKKGNTVWAICRDEYLRYDMTTGLLEIYETERDAQTNKQTTRISSSPCAYSETGVLG